MYNVWHAVNTPCVLIFFSSPFLSFGLLFFFPLNALFLCITFYIQSFHIITLNIMPVTSVESPTPSLWLTQYVGPQFIPVIWNLDSKGIRGFLLPVFLGLPS